ncbi:integrase catalytic domain-containing protein [Actinomyces slackii]|nr:transposase family protein [Actinomyces slackii]
MGSELSMGARAEITRKYATAYARASKGDKGRMLDEVCAVTGWSRDNARRRLTQAAKRPGGAKKEAPRPRGRKYSYDALKVLQKVWAASGGQCGKYLAASMPLLLDLLQSHGELDDEPRYTPQVRAELEAMSAATIDRYLAPVRAKDPVRGISTTKAGPLLRNSITIRKAGDEIEAAPGFFEVDTVAHCGPVLKGEFARTLNMTDVLTGWVFTRTMRNNAEKHIIAALDAAIDAVPFPLLGMDFDNGSEFINHGVVAWAGNLGIYFTRARPYRKNDQATIESKNNHLVRRYGFYYRYDTDTERATLNRLWSLVDDRLNFLTPTRKPVGWGTDKAGRRKRLYDAPATPLERLLSTDALTGQHKDELIAYRDSLNPAKIARRIHDLQASLIMQAKTKTDELYAAQIPSALPDVHHSIRVKKASRHPTRFAGIPT